MYEDKVTNYLGLLHTCIISSKKESQTRKYFAQCSEVGGTT